VEPELKLGKVASAKRDFQKSMSPTWPKRVLTSLIALLILQVPACGWARSPQKFSSIGLALEGIRQTFFISTGFENATGDLDKTPVALDLSRKNVASVFDALVSQRPSYAWRLEDGFYDVYPKTEADSFSHLSVTTYVVTDATLIGAVHAIDELPEVQKWLLRRRVSRGDLIFGSRLLTPGVPYQPQRRSFTLMNVSVRSILNHIYSDFDQTQWTVWREGQRISMLLSF